MALKLHFRGINVRLPHITVEYRDEETTGVGKLSFPLVMGMGLHWAWVFSAMHSANELFSHSNEDAGAFMVIVSMAFMAFTLLAYALFTKEIRPLFETASDRRRVRLVAASIDSLGFLLAAVGVCATNGFLCWSLALVGGVTTGVGSAALLMSYGVSYSVCDTATSAMQFALSSLVTAAGYALIVLVNAHFFPVGIALCVALPWVELLCLNASSKNLVDRTEFTTATMPVYQGRFFWRMTPSALSFGFLFGFIGVHAFQGTREMIANETSFVWAVLLAGTITCLLVVAVMLTQRQRANYAFRTLNPVNAFIIALTAYLIATNPGVIVHCLFLTSYMLLEACLWISYSDMSQKFRLSPFHVFGAGRGMVAAGAVIATILMLPSSPLFEWLNSVNSILPVSFVLLILGTSAYPRDPEIVDVLKRGNACPAFFDPFDPSNDTRKFLQQVSLEQEAEMKAAAEQQNAEGSKGVTEETAAKPSPATETPVAKEEGAQGEEERIGRYKRRCLALADMCLLSRRETEVLFLLAKGYNAKMIQEQLYISAGTANTHMRHVYRKLDVHNQEDLIRMVDSIEVADEVWN